MTTKKRKRVALNLNGREIELLGRFLCNGGIAHELGANGRASAAYARETWGTMSPVARSAVIRLGLKPRLTALGCIPPT